MKKKTSKKKSKRAHVCTIPAENLKACYRCDLRKTGECIVGTGSRSEEAMVPNIMATPHYNCVLISCYDFTEETP